MIKKNLPFSFNSSELKRNGLNGTLLWTLFFEYLRLFFGYLKRLN